MNGLKRALFQQAPRGAEAGLSLVEIIVGLALMALVAVAVSQALFGTLAASSFERDRAELTQAAQGALQRMADFTRETDLVTTPSQAQPVDSRLMVNDLYLGTDDDIEFHLDAASGQLLEDGPSGEQVLAGNVSSFVVRRTATSGSQPLITIELTLSRGNVSVSLTTAVLPRNDPDIT